MPNIFNLNYDGRKIVIELDNEKHFILSPTSRLYQYCLTYLEAIPIPIDPKGYINLDYFFTLPEEILKYQSIEESTRYIVSLLRNLSSEIEEIDSIYWSTSEWKYKVAYNNKIDKYLTLLVGLGFLGRIDLLEEEEKYLGEEVEEYNVYQYLLELTQIERKRWQKILNARSRHKLQRLQLV